MVRSYVDGESNVTCWRNGSLVNESRTGATSLLRMLLLLAGLLTTFGCARTSDGRAAPNPPPLESQSPATAQQRFTTVRVDLRTQRIELFLQDDSGRTFHRFDSLKAWLATRNRRLIFAMNAGMYEPDFSPVGLLVQEGRQIAPLNLRSGTGNFYLKPNGVLLIDSAGARIVASESYPALSRSVRLATQSGPLLVLDGALHPAFNAASTSRWIRNGVGVRGDTAIFVISEIPVTFHELATYFRDSLGCRDALYLDGTVSSLYSETLGRNDYRTELGPIIAVVE